MVTCCGAGVGPQANEPSIRPSAVGAVSVIVHVVPTCTSGVMPDPPTATSNGYVCPLLHTTSTWNDAPPLIPWVSPVAALVTLTRPKMGTVGFVTVTATGAPATIVAMGAGDQVGAPHVKPGASRPGSGGISCMLHVVPTGSPGTVWLPLAVSVTDPVKPGPQS